MADDKCYLPYRLIVISVGVVLWLYFSVLLSNGIKDWWVNVNQWRA